MPTDNVRHDDDLQRQPKRTHFFGFSMQVPVRETLRTSVCTCRQSHAILQVTACKLACTVMACKPACNCHKTTDQQCGRPPATTLKTFPRKKKIWNSSQRTVGIANARTYSLRLGSRCDLDLASFTVGHANKLCVFSIYALFLASVVLAAAVWWRIPSIWWVRSARGQGVLVGTAGDQACSYAQFHSRVHVSGLGRVRSGWDEVRAVCCLHTRCAFSD